ncbi:MAG: cellulase family glycosylhydrolase [Armatimonadota bacterium]
MDAAEQGRLRKKISSARRRLFRLVNIIRAIELSLVLIPFMVLKTCASNNGLPDPVVPSCLGVNIHFVGREDDQVEQIAKAGFRFIRMDFHWSSVEKEKGVYDFRAYDELVASLASRGIRPLFILDYGNPLYDRGLAPRTEKGRQAFARFAAQAVRHFRGKGVLWEIWNEPNLAQFWRPSPNPEHYVRLVEAVSRAMKKEDPECTILAPALSGWDFGFLETVCRLGLLSHIDVVSVHPYGCSVPEDAKRYYERVRRIIAEYKPAGKNIPVVSGEWGYSAVGGFSVDRQAEYLTRMFLVNLMNDIRLSIWYDWRDDGPDPEEREHHFGTVYLDLREKPAYFAMQTLARELDGYSYASRICVGSERDYLLLFRKGDNCRLVAWTVDEPHRVRLPVDVREFELVSILGDRKRVDVANGVLELDLSGAVTYIKPLSKSKRWNCEALWNVLAKVEWVSGRQVVRIFSSLPCGGRLTVTGLGLAEPLLTELSSGEFVADGFYRFSIPYVWSGDESSRVRAVLAVDGVEPPLARCVDLNVDECIRAEIMPPMDNCLIVGVLVPSSARIPRAKLVINGAQGVEFESSNVWFDCRRGEVCNVRLPLRKLPETVFEFSFDLYDERDRKLVGFPRKKYAVVEAFSGGVAGETVEGCQCILDGDHSVEASASLTYSACPDHEFEQVCSRLDYCFEKGWRFVRISPRRAVGIDGKPSAARIWVRGDGSNTAARLRFVDSSGQTFQPDYGQVDFVGWKCLTAPMTGVQAGYWGGPSDGVVRYPISWDSFFLLDNVGGRKRCGRVYLGPLMLLYD